MEEKTEVIVAQQAPGCEDENGRAANGLKFMADDAAYEAAVLYLVIAGLF